MLVLLFYELVKHRGDIGIYDAIRNLKDDFDRVKCVEDDYYVRVGATAQRFSSIYYIVECRNMIGHDAIGSYN
jgi:hypothetical protein